MPIIAQKKAKNFKNSMKKIKISTALKNLHRRGIRCVHLFPEARGQKQWNRAKGQGAWANRPISHLCPKYKSYKINMFCCLSPLRKLKISDYDGNFLFIDLN